MRKKSNRVGGSIFAIIGLLMMIGAWIFFQNGQKFMKEAVSATGMVVESVYVKSRKGKGRYYPVVEFQTVDGKSKTFRSDTGSSRPTYENGEQVSILYEKQNPANAKIAGFWELWGLSAVLAVFGLIFMGVGLKIR
jgi:hypothetical protein